MSAPAISHRTILRDAVVAALQAAKQTDRVRVKKYDVSTNYLNADELKQDVTYCAIVTDEAPAGQTMREDDCRLTLTLVLYVRDQPDVRAALDASIEDVYETLLLVQASVQETIWQMKLEQLTTDENTTAAKPIAQAVQRWTCRHHRRATAF